jgi:hypothetical protein
MMRSVAGLLIVVAIGVLAYGYWFGATHGSLYVTVMDVTDREHPVEAKTVQLLFRDGNDRVLAEAAGSEPAGAIFVSSPAEYACHDEEQRAVTSDESRQGWAKCFERQSTWLPSWVRQVKSTDVLMSSCTIQRMPVSLSEHPDTWWLWWVPLRHIGGKPYTSFSFTILFNRSACA